MDNRSLIEAYNDWKATMIASGHRFKYSKECKVCGEIKMFSEFTPHKEMADGYLSLCRKCNAKRAADKRNGMTDRWCSLATE